MPTPGAVPATMGKRLLAYVIDMVACVVLGGGFVVAGTLPLIRTMQDTSGAPVVSVSPILGIGYVILLGFGIFQWWFLGTRGYTVGKKLVGLRALCAQTGQPVGMGRAFLRLLVPAAGSLLFVGQALVYVSPFFDSSGRRQGWHDKLAGTMVFDTTIGRDPATAGLGVGAPDAVRRLDGLLQRPPDSRPPAPPASPVPAPLLVLGPTFPPVPQALAAPAPWMYLPAVPAPPAPASVPNSEHAQASDTAPSPGSAPAPERAVTADPALASAAARSARHAAAAGIISSVPGSLLASGLTESVAPSAVPPAPAPVFMELDDDVEMTRLSSASRRAVEEIPLGVRAVPCATLLLWDDRKVLLEGTALIGRNPTPRPGERAPEQIITVTDKAKSVSKTHLAIGVDVDGVWLHDRNSTNGTIVTLDDGQQILCAPEQQVRVPAGAAVAFGDYWLTVLEA